MGWEDQPIREERVMDGWTRVRGGRRADLVELEPLVVGRVEDAVDVGLALGGERRVGEDEVEARGDVGGPLAEHLLAHDLGAGAEPVQAQEPRPPPRALRLGPRVAAEAAHRGGSGRIGGTEARGRAGAWALRRWWAVSRWLAVGVGRGVEAERGIYDGSTPRCGGDGWVTARFLRAVLQLGVDGPRAPCRCWHALAYWPWLERPCRGACGNRVVWWPTGGLPRSARGLQRYTYTMTFAGRPGPRGSSVRTSPGTRGEGRSDGCISLR